MEKAKFDITRDNICNMDMSFSKQSLISEMNIAMCDNAPLVYGPMSAQPGIISTMINRSDFQVMLPKNKKYSASIEPINGMDYFNNIDMGVLVRQKSTEHDIVMG